MNFSKNMIKSLVYSNLNQTFYKSDKLKKINTKQRPEACKWQGIVQNHVETGVIRISAFRKRLILTNIVHVKKNNNWISHNQWLNKIIRISNIFSKVITTKDFRGILPRKVIYINQVRYDNEVTSPARKLAW